MPSIDGTHAQNKGTNISNMVLMPEHKTLLLEKARQSIAHGLQKRRPLPCELETYDLDLQEFAATFVTLHTPKHGRLRGCIGSLEAHQPLIKDTITHAYAAAFNDPRFPPLTVEEFKEVHIEISILTPNVEIEFEDEEDLLSKLTPQVDGILIEDSGYQATFLPQVWEGLPTPIEFLTQLKLKAGLAADHWSNSFKVYRYSVISFEED